MRALLAILAAVLLAGCGSSTETVTVTTTVTQTVTETAPGDATALPDAVEETRRGLLEAAQSGDVDALEPFVTDRLSYSFGEPVEGGAIAYFKQLEAQGQDPLGTLAKLLQLPYTLAQGNYVWPWVYTRAGHGPHRLREAAPRRVRRRLRRPDATSAVPRPRQLRRPTAQPRIVPVQVRPVD